MSEIERRVEPQKSPEDERSYRVVRLRNGLRCILVHDHDAPAAAAAMRCVVNRAHCLRIGAATERRARCSVNVGSVHNPPHVKGLAHFLVRVRAQAHSSSTQCV